jgi:signal transduction histidine kinase
MPTNNHLNFKISSALKTIIGKELITNDFIAVFELVKNSFDAYATNVKVIFRDLYGGSPSILIQDDGKGMDYKEITEKWLFVAYSSKRESGAIQARASDDYRHKIESHRVYAGAKGVGRFSCDRLGSRLKVFTTSQSEVPKTHSITVNWGDFEKNTKSEFVNIPISYELLKRNPYLTKRGTVLEISGLRDNWNREKLLKLKHSLEKLINPNQDNDSKGFKIIIEADEEKSADKEATDERGRVNGEVHNFIFENLKLKTTRIHAEVTADGKHITTELIDRGIRIYKIKEKNTFPYLSNIKVHLFQLNQAAKAHFTRLMGVPAVQYGSVFLYLNGFRIYPFGEEGEDTLGIDRRKQQGHSRFLGTRDLIGRIEINGNNDDFKETSSRDGGLIKTDAYFQLEDFFKERALRRLERYVVDAIKWGDPDREFNTPALEPKDVKKEIFEIISKLTSSKEVVDVEYDPAFLNIMKDLQKESVSTIFKNFSRIAEDTNNPTLSREVEKAKKQLATLVKANEEAEKQLELAEGKKKESEKALQVEKKKYLFLLATAKDTSPETLGLVHHIKIATGGINYTIKNFVKKVQADNYTKDDILTNLQQIQLYSSKVQVISNLITKANFNLKVDKQRGDLISFIDEYLTDKDIAHSDIEIVFNKKKASYDALFSVLEVSVILDNLIDNAKKAKAKTIQIDVVDSKSVLKLLVSDDGNGIDPEIAKHIFELGISSTKGSGIGLYTVTQLLKEMGASIKVLPTGSVLKGATFELQFRK